MAKSKRSLSSIIATLSNLTHSGDMFYAHENTAGIDIACRVVSSNDSEYVVFWTGNKNNPDDRINGFCGHWDVNGNIYNLITTRELKKLFELAKINSRNKDNYRHFLHYIKVGHGNLSAMTTTHLVRLPSEYEFNFKDNKNHADASIYIPTDILTALKYIKERISWIDVKIDTDVVMIVVQLGSDYAGECDKQMHIVYNRKHSEHICEKCFNMIDSFVDDTKDVIHDGYTVDRKSVEKSIAELKSVSTDLVLLNYDNGTYNFTPVTVDIVNEAKKYAQSNANTMNDKYVFLNTKYLKQFFNTALLKNLSHVKLFIKQNKYNTVFSTADNGLTFCIARHVVS